MGTYAWNKLYCKILPAKSSTAGLPNQAEHQSLATSPKHKLLFSISTTLDQLIDLWPFLKELYDVMKLTYVL